MKQLRQAGGNESYFDERQASALAVSGHNCTVHILMEHAMAMYEKSYDAQVN